MEAGSNIMKSSVKKRLADLREYSERVLTIPVKDDLVENILEYQRELDRSEKVRHVVIERSGRAAVYLLI
jgi:hypothetical protein